MSFLKAEWRKLAIVNYVIDPKILKKDLPFGTELDFWEEKCYVSLVGFRFLNTKLLGFKIPFHVNFSEVNLRFYVKRFSGDEWRRGVVFIKEIVPKPALSFVANMVYNENYETLTMKHAWHQENKQLEIAYSWKKKGNWQEFKVIADNTPTPLEADSETEFITEHYWGYASVNTHKSNEYQVTHPRWDIYPVKNHEINVDFGLTYGSRFAFLNDLTPASVMLAEGSEITVETKNSISN